MSPPITIPTGASSSQANYNCCDARKEAAASPSSPSSYSSSPSSPEPETKSSHSDGKRKAAHRRRESLLSPSILIEKCTTINIGDEDQPRLISYISSSQGFIWNPEFFIPSYMDYDFEPLDNRLEPVHDIHLSDEEIKKMLPQQ